MLKPNIIEMDLGEIKFGKTYNFEYSLTNDTGKDMKINRVVVSCHSCTKASGPSKIRGNGTGTINVSYTPGIVGKTNKWIDVIYDDDKTLRLTFKANING